MKRIICLFLMMIFSVLFCGCAPECISGLTSEPMDASIFEVLDSDTQAFFENFSEEFPVSMTVNYDQHFDICTVTDAALMSQMYAAIAEIHVNAKTNISSTDGYHSVKFTTAEGENYGLSFENSVLCVGDDRYKIDNAEAFWKLFKTIAEENNPEAEPELGAPFFAFFNDADMTAFAENFYDEAPTTLFISFQWESITEKTVTDAEGITAVFEALEPIVVVAPSDTYTTDFDTFLTFAYDDGREYSFCFNGYNLVLKGGSSSETLYELAYSEALWELLKAYQGE